MKSQSKLLKGSVMLTIIIPLIAIVLSSCKLTNKDDFDTSLIPVYDGEKCGYVDSDGKYIINPQFDEADYFFDGLAIVKLKDKYGYIDREGKYVINPIYKDVTRFKDGIAYTVMPGEKIKVIDKKGTVLKILDFFLVKINEGDYSIYITNEGKSGLMTLDGNKIIGNFKDYDISGTNNGYVKISNEKGKGLATIDGNIIIKPEYERIGDFHDGYATFRKNGKYGIMDETGKYIVNPQFEDLNYIGDGIYAFKLDLGDKWGFCDEKGKITVNPQFSSVEEMGEYGLIPVTINDKWGYVDINGKIIINPQFYSASHFRSDYAIVSSGYKEYGIIDKEGKYRANPQFEVLGSSPNLLNNYVLSDFFDLKGAVNKIKSIISKDSIFGVSFSSNISEIMSQNMLSETSMRRSSETKVKSEILMNNVEVTLKITGNFFSRVSDGWWGYTTVLNSNARPGGYNLYIDLSGKGKDKATEVATELLKSCGVNGFSEYSSTEVKINGKVCYLSLPYGGGIKLAFPN